MNKLTKSTIVSVYLPDLLLERVEEQMLELAKTRKPGERIKVNRSATILHLIYMGLGVTPEEVFGVSKPKKELPVNKTNGKQY